jgi:serine/threonine protein kinase/tetratricopeptide (TPR) repeat protein
MNPQRWQQLESLFQSALERRPEQRDSFLADACAGHETLRAEVESLIACHEEAGGFIDTPIIDGNPGLLDDGEVDSVADRRIGPYKILREIGHGGMGTVCLAIRDDEQFKKLVAIKIVRSGMDTEFILHRFRSERQILALLDHPNIARLHDGGITQGGLPYFVMEYVEGKPIYEYCDTHEFSTVERLKLFRGICSAVQYAHQNLVVHRDIKPGNILVTDDGVPMLLDFGIAKLLDSELSDQTIEPTATALRLMTPEYASPEQVRGEAITTATDIYSLGVLLYELLTGHRPYRLTSHTPFEIARIVCDEEPEKPSSAVNRVEEVVSVDGKGSTTTGRESVRKTRGGQPEKLHRRLAGDLDNIVMKSMNKDPRRRYASVEQFSEDIRRHLEGLPVIARKDTFRYRSGKFVRRHKSGVAAATLIGLVFAAGTIGIAWQTMVARSERAKAERRFNDVRRVANSFMFEVHDAIANLAGSTSARELVVKRALEYLDGLAREAGNDPSLQRELAEAYHRLAEIQGSPTDANLGDTAGALESFRKALALRESLVASRQATVEDRRMLAATYGKLSALGSDPAARIDYARKALEIREALSAAEPENALLRSSLAISYHDVGLALSASGNVDDALESYRKMQVIYEALSAAEPGNALRRRNLALACKRVAALLYKSGDLSGSITNYRRAEAIDEALAATDPSDAQARLDLTYSLSGVGDALVKTNDTKSALAKYQRVLVIRQALAAADPKDVRTRLAVAGTYRKLGGLTEMTGDRSAALETYRKAMEIAEELSTADPLYAGNKIMLADVICNIASLHLAIASDAKTPATRRPPSLREARRWYQRALELVLELKTSGIQPGIWTEYTPDTISKQIENCDALLSRAKDNKRAKPGNQP